MKKAHICTLSLALFLSLLIVPSYALGTFTDVANDAYYVDAVAWGVQNNIAAGTGDNKFSPDQTCTKAQIIAFIWRAYGSEDAGDTRLVNNNPFPDLDGSEYYFEAAKWAFTHGLVVGGSAFNGDEPCKRSTVMWYMWKAAGEPAPTTQTTFTDLIPALHDVNAISWAVEKGIAADTSDTTFSPDTTCTRAQIISFLYRNLVKPVEQQQSQTNSEESKSTRPFTEEEVEELLKQPVSTREMTDEEAKRAWDASAGLFTGETELHQAEDGSFYYFY